MINFPECQQKLQAELDSVIGENRVITTVDRAKLPYTNAVVNVFFIATFNMCLYILLFLRKLCVW